MGTRQVQTLRSAHGVIASVEDATINWVDARRIVAGGSGYDSGGFPLSGVDRRQWFAVSRYRFALMAKGNGEEVQTADRVRTNRFAQGMRSPKASLWPPGTSTTKSRSPHGWSVNGATTLASSWLQRPWSASTPVTPI